jgi:hypothetical protein
VDLAGSIFGGMRFADHRGSHRRRLAAALSAEV